MFIIMHIKMTLYSIPHKLYKAIIVKRPSATCKTPYVADVYIPELDLHTMAHSPSLGCCGLADKDHEVMVHEQTNKKTVCKYVIMLSHIYEKNIITRYDQLANNMIIGYALIPIKSLTSQIYSIEKNK